MSEESQRPRAARGWYRLTLAATVSAISFCGAFAAGPQDSAWPMFHQNARNEARTTTAIATSPTVLWSAPLTDSPEYSSPVIDIDGNVYIGDLGEQLQKFDPTGALVWSFDAGGNFRRSSPAIADDGTVYIGSADGKLYAVNPDGTEKWAFEAGGAVKTSPTIGSDGTIYFGSDDGSLYSVGPDGTLGWTYATADTVRSSPAVLDGVLVAFGSNDGGVYAVDESGALIWSGFTGGPVKAPISLGQGGDVIVPSQDGFLYAIGQTGFLQWTVLTENTLRSAAAIGLTGKIYVPVDDELHCYRDSGDQSYTVTLSGRILSSPAVYTDLADTTDSVVVGTEDGNLYGIKLGEILWSVPIGAAILSSPAIGSDGTIYFGANDGRLYAVGEETSGTSAPLDPGAIAVAGPSPVRAGDLVTFRIPKFADGQVFIHDPSGRRLDVLRVNGGSAEWTAGGGDRLNSGVFFYRWESEAGSGAGRIVVVR